MIKSQRSVLKLFFVFFTMFVMVCSSGICNGLQNKLGQADSLFQQKKYVQSLKIYENIRQQGYASPAMLLKMAYINEAEEDIGGSLYYLNLYYQLTHNKKVLNKMQTMAEEHDLHGYQYRDLDFFLNIFYNYKYHIMLLLVAITFLIFGIIIFQSRKYNHIAMVNKVVMIALVVLVLVMVNVNFEPDYGIIKSNNVFIMDGPSAAAQPLEIAKSGHRVKIIGKHDVWMKVLWGDKTGFIKKYNLEYI